MTDAKNPERTDMGKEELFFQLWAEDTINSMPKLPTDPTEKFYKMREHLIIKAREIEVSLIEQSENQRLAHEYYMKPILFSTPSPDADVGELVRMIDFVINNPFPQGVTPNAKKGSSE